MIDHRPRIKSFALATVLSLVCVASLAAHGGAYRGLPVPGAPPPPPNPFATTPRPNPSGSTPRPVLSPYVPVRTVDDTSWQYWWFYNREAFLQPSRRAAEAKSDGKPVQTPNRQGTERRIATDAHLNDVAIPWLYRQLKSSKHRDVQTACLLALAKIGNDHQSFELVPLIRQYLKKGKQQLRETSALALGVTYRIEAIPILAGLALDTKIGRRAVGRSKVDDRTRAFAIYGLGLLGRSNDAVEIKEQVFDIFSQILTKPGKKDREVLLAAVKAMGALRPDLRIAAHKRLMWRILPELWAFYERTMSRSMHVTQAHVPTAIATLLGRGTSADHQRYKAQFSQQLKRTKRHETVRQSFVLALGQMVEPAEVHAADADYSKLLQKQYKSGRNRFIRQFALIAIGRIGGDDNRKFLQSTIRHSSKTKDRPWAALGLGLLSHKKRQDGEVDQLVGRALLDQFHEIKNPESRAAVVIAIGLSGYTDGVDAMRKTLVRSKGQDVLLAHSEIAFALLGQNLGIGSIGDFYRPLVCSQTAIARAALSEPGIANTLDSFLRLQGPNEIALGAIAAAFRFVPGRPQLSLVTETKRRRKMSAKLIAFTAIAQGMIADKSAESWNAIYALGSNYAARLPTLEDGQAGILDIL